MKRLLLAIAVLALLALIPISQGVFAAPDQVNKVYICHFNGHAGDAVITVEQIERCEVWAGGNALSVGIPACINGHGIEFGCLPPE